MALFTTLTLGLPFYVIGLFQNTGRAARGNGAVAAWVLLWVLAAALVAAVQRHRRMTARGERPEVPLLAGLAVIVFAWILLAAGWIGRAAGDFGMSPRGEPAAWAFLLALPGLGLAVVGPRLAPRLGRRAHDGPLPAGPLLIAALVPLLMPALALVQIRELPVAAPYTGRISGLGLSGILFLQLETVTWPALLVVAWALDRSDGTRTGRFHDLVLGLSVLVLLWMIVAPLYVDPEASLLVRAGGDGSAQELLQVDELVRGAAIMVTACALLSADALRRLPAVGRSLRALECLVLVVASVVIPWTTVPGLGPHAAPWGVTIACAMTWCAYRGRARQRVGGG